MDNPELMDEILLEGIKVKKESETQLKKLQHEINALQQRKEELAKFGNQGEIRVRVKQALRIFKKSSSLHKKQVIQMMVPKLVMDEKNDRLSLFINPFLEKAFKNSDLSLNETKPILTLNSQNSGRGKITGIGENQMVACPILSQSEKKVRVATEWRAIWALPELLSSNHYSSSLHHSI